MKSQNKEIWLALGFMLLGSWVSNGWLYSILVIIFLLSLYLVTGNFLKSLWLTFVPVYLFYRAIHFTFPSFFIAYADPLLLLILIVLAFRQKPTPRVRFRKDSNRAIHLIMFLIVTLGVLSSLLSAFTDVSLFYLLQLVKFFIVFLVSGIILSDKSVRKLTLTILFMFILFNAVLIVLQKVNGSPLGIPIETENLFARYGRYADESPGLYRPGGITTGPNEMATVLGMSIPLIFSLGISRNKYNKSFLWVCLIFSGAALLFTAARAVWIVVAVAVPAVYLTLKNSKLLDFPVFISKYRKLLVIGFALVSFPIVINRISSLSTFFKPGGGGVYRIRHLVMAAKLADIFPFGVGANVFQSEIGNRFDQEYFFYDSTPAHNVFAEVMADFGYAGIPLFILLFYTIARGHYPFSHRPVTPLKLGVFWGVIVYILLLQVHPWLFERSASSLFWILGGLRDDSD